LIAELLATYFLVFAGCGVITVNIDKNNVVGQPGIAIVWGAAVMVPGYIVAQILASILASGTLRLIFSGPHDHFVGNVPIGSDIRSFVMEIIITFYLMFVITAVATDNRATGELAGVAIGGTILLNAMFAGPISGASMNPARSIGPALVWNQYKGLWVYVVGPMVGAIGGAWAYNTIRFTDKPLSEITKGCGVVVVDVEKDNMIGQTGISIVWGLVVMVMIYSVGHISGAHFNPAVTIAFASCKRFPLKNVPAYVCAQIMGSTLASVSLRLIFNWKHNNLGATVPSGSDVQSLVLEFIITFYLMFVIAGVATDNRAVRASMNPARTLGPAVVSSQYKGLWVYILGPVAGAVAGAWAYNIIRFTTKPLHEIVKGASFLQRTNPM
ncbi:Aquaporin-like protein, partial [Cynara cardunculus var. scolymus]